MKFTIEVVKGVYRLVAEDRRFWVLPENTKSVCFDEDGEIWAYESGNVTIPKGNKAWIDQGSDGFVVQIGKTAPIDVKGKTWRTEIKVPSQAQCAADAARKAIMEAEAPKPKADRRVLRGLVLDSITRDVEAGELGARNTAAIIRDLDVATFNGYTTLKLVQAFALAGYDIRNTHTMKAFEAIDRKVQEAWA
ncbi:MAG: hypothetical protein ACRC8W_02030 [Plesiomonas shigelloides]